MTWTIQGKATIVDGERIVAVCDTWEDAELIIAAVNDFGSSDRTIDRLVAMGETIAIMLDDCGFTAPAEYIKRVLKEIGRLPEEIKVGGTDD
jgi:hypothetical protein